MTKTFGKKTMVLIGTSSEILAYLGKYSKTNILLKDLLNENYCLH
jgi:hypothetical protein